MSLLFSNDTQGSYPPSWYAATAQPLPAQDPLRGKERADVCVIGAGYTGLSTALHLAEMGFNVAVVEAHRIGFGASGRNGGQLGSGQRVEQNTLERLVGKADAAKFWALAEDSKSIVKGLIEKHSIDCQLRPGVADFGLSVREGRELADYAKFLQDRYNYQDVQPLGIEEGHAICPSPAYNGGLIDRGAAHLHPLRYVLGLGQAALSAGVRIFEASTVHHVVPGTNPVVQTERGQITCDTVVFAGNGYLGNLNRKVASRVLPINNFIVATEPLGAETAKVLCEDVAVADTKFVVNYFRLSEDGRLLFGGGESYSDRFPADIANKVRGPMQRIFPHLADIKIDYAWGGTLGITVKRLPYLVRLAPNMLSASGYSGHGVGTATQAGKLMANAINGQAQGFDTMAALPSTPFPGSGFGRRPLMNLAMTWYALRDRLGI